MKPWLADQLVCPYDGGRMQLEIEETDGDEIKTGSLRSPSGRIYPIRNCIPRFADSDAYAQSFSTQRRHVRAHLATYIREFDQEANARLFTQSTGFDLKG